ncbi:MAG: trigger factor [Lachnospiraceae bacterium]|nr:trigger factor [Lachnospiraceae bacterium]
MSVQVEKLEKSMAKLTITVPAAEFDAAIDQAYKKARGRINLPGFRKGKAPRNLIEKMYGSGVFYEDAANIVIPEAYSKAAEESELEIVSRPSINVTQIEAGKDFIFTAEVAVKPEVTLGEYKGLSVEKTVLSVSDDEVMAELKKEQEKNSTEETVTDRDSALGDIVNIDYEGFVDDVAFAGGTAQGQNLTLGSHSFIDTFEDQLVGKKAGDDVEVSVTFPEEYHAEELAGKPAIFKVHINKVSCKELPELDDEFASEVSSFDTLEEYKKSVSDKLMADKAKAQENELRQAVLDQAIANATMEIAEAQVDAECDNVLRDFEQRIGMQGISLDQYLQFTGSDVETMKEEIRPQALQRIQSRLVLEAVAAAEGIKASDDAVDSEMEKMAAQYQLDVEDVKKYFGETGKENIREDLSVQLAMDFLFDNAVFTEKAAEE